MKNKQLALAIAIASNTHLYQFDKSGKPYILHPLHLMNQLLFDIELATIAVLHDVIEDSGGTYTEERLKVQFSERVANAVILLTHDPKDTYEEYIDKICTNYDSIRVKRKDLEHNSDISRLKGVTGRDLARIVKYHKAFTKLGEARKQFTKS